MEIPLITNVNNVMVHVQNVMENPTEIVSNVNQEDI